MKKATLNKLLGLTLSAVLALSALTGCAQLPATTPEATPAPVAETTAPVTTMPETPVAAEPTTDTTATPESTATTESGAVGSVLLSVNPEILMEYDQLGNVVALTALNDDGRAVLKEYTGYEGKACTDVIAELVSRINQGGYFDTTIAGRERNIVLKLEQGSEYPHDAFLTQLAEAVQAAVTTDQIGSETVMLDADDWADSGYISAQAAQELLATQLGRSDLQFIEKEYDLSDGEYELEFLLDGVIYEYEVDAATGKVKEIDVDRPDPQPDTQSTQQPTEQPTQPDRYDDDWDDRYDDDDDWDDRYDDDDDDWDDDWDDDDDDDDDDWDDDWDDDDDDDDDDWDD